jgi:hypothetical protein
MRLSNPCLRSLYFLAWRQRGAGPNPASSPNRVYCRGSGHTYQLARRGLSVDPLWRDTWPMPAMVLQVIFRTFR